MTEQIGNSPAGIIERIPLAKRQRSIYWRPMKQPDGTMGWEKTCPLPSDLVGRNQYLSKGFRLDNPNENVRVDETKALKEEITALREALNEKVTQEVLPAEDGVNEAPLYVSDKPEKPKRARRKA